MGLERRRRLDNWRLIMQWHPEKPTRNGNWQLELIGLPTGGPEMQVWR